MFDVEVSNNVKTDFKLSDFVKMIQSVWKFLCYWYFRYLMVTELYMVERWERAVISILLIWCPLSHCFKVIPLITRFVL
jgi:hypothetical protein